MKARDPIIRARASSGSSKRRPTSTCASPICTTAAQYFHLLRRQAVLLLTDPLPLIVLTPKSLLRHPLVASRPRDLAEGRWQPVIPDEDAAGRGREIRRVAPLQRQGVCRSRDERASRASTRRSRSVRVEQLYPFPWSDLKPVLEGFPALEEIVWVQEEPENMGAWGFVRPLIEELAEGRWPLCYVGRARSASPSEGTQAGTRVNQKTLVAQAFEPAPARKQTHMVLSEERCTCRSAAVLTAVGPIGHQMNSWTSSFRSWGNRSSKRAWRAG